MVSPRVSLVFVNRNYDISLLLLRHMTKEGYDLWQASSILQFCCYCNVKAMTHQPTQLLSLVKLEPVGVYVIGLQLDFSNHFSLIPDCFVGSRPPYDSTVELGWLMCHGLYSPVNLHSLYYTFKMMALIYRRAQIQRSSTYKLPYLLTTCVNLILFVPIHFTQAHMYGGIGGGTHVPCLDQNLYFVDIKLTNLEGLTFSFYKCMPPF